MDDSRLHHKSATASGPFGLVTTPMSLLVMATGVAVWA
jgi:hypothetical protein